MKVGARAGKGKVRTSCGSGDRVARCEAHVTTVTSGLWVTRAGEKR